MNTVQLECFIAVAEHLNFSKASEALRITQPAVSHQIRALEEELGVKLFRRTSKNVALTQEGLEFLPDAELILKTALSAKERLGQHERFLPFEIGCHNRMEINLMPPILRELARDFPLLRPAIQLVPFPSLLSLVENRQLHAAFGIKEEQKKSSLYFRELCSAPVACLCSPTHPLTRHGTLTTKQLSGNFIACSPPPDRRPGLRRPEQYRDKAAAGTALFCREYGKRHYSCQSTARIYAVSRHRSGKGSRSKLHTGRRFSRDVFRRLLQV